MRAVLLWMTGIVERCRAEGRRLARVGWAQLFLVMGSASSSQGVESRSASVSTWGPRTRGVQSARRQCLNRYVARGSAVTGRTLAVRRWGPTPTQGGIGRGDTRARPREGASRDGALVVEPGIATEDLVGRFARNWHRAKRYCPRADSGIGLCYLARTSQELRRTRAAPADNRTVGRQCGVFEPALLAAVCEPRLWPRVGVSAST